METKQKATLTREEMKNVQGGGTRYYCLCNNGTTINGAVSETMIDDVDRICGDAGGECFTR